MYLLKVSKSKNYSTRLFGLYKSPEKHLMLQKTCRQFAETELKPNAAQLDREHKFSAGQIKKLGKLGLLSIGVSKKYGGAGQDSLALAVAVEEISRGCAATGTIVSIYNCLYANFLNKCGTTDENKDCPMSPFCYDTALPYKNRSNIALSSYP